MNICNWCGKEYEVLTGETHWLPPEGKKRKYYSHRFCCWDHGYDAEIHRRSHTIREKYKVDWEGKVSFSYTNALKVWTSVDVEKRQKAIDNKLNWVEFFTVEQVRTWLC